MDIVKLCLMLLIYSGHSSAQGLKQFAPETVSLYKPVSATSSCGSEGAEPFCEYSEDFDADASLSPNCLDAVCNSTCRHASSSPSPTDLVSIGTLGGGITFPSGSGPGETAVLEFTDSFIHIPSSSEPRISSDGFTLAVWMKQDDSNDGALISKASSNGLDRTYALSVTESSITFDYLPNDAESGYSTLSYTNLKLSSNFWHHIAITVYEDDFALYINGTVEEAAGLTAAIDDSTDTLYLGQISPALNYYNGLMQDVYFYTQALTAREIEELATGNFPFNSLQDECRCPSSHPVINSVSSGLCIQHSGTQTDRGAETRLNSLSHTVGYINDNSFFTTWISGIDVQQSNVTMTLVSGSSSAYELILLFIRFSSPAPKAAVLEKSIDGGKTFVPLQYFASDCMTYFGMEDDASLKSNDDVNCITEYSSQTPISGATITVSFADGSRGALISSNTELQDFILADHVQLRLIDYFTMNTTAQHRYYALRDITVAARCSCHYHAEECSDEALCACVHNTQGDRCEECLPLYNDKPWREGTSDIGYPCKMCDCNNHATACHYNASIDPNPDSYDLGGGGVCDDCQDNTAGTNCDTCVFSYYRKTGVDPSDAEPCSPCDCDSVGSTGEDCVKQEGMGIVGQCDCRDNVQGRTCNECKVGYFNLSSSNTQGCQSCDCNTDGTVDASESCNNVTGQCSCKSNVEGVKCDQCNIGSYGLNADDPDGCSLCSCSAIGSIDDSTCDPISGNCTCKPGVGGMSCDQCKSGFYDFSQSGCQQCQCSDIGSLSLACNVNNGICSCKSGYTGQNCDQCEVGFFNSSQTCVACQCNENGTVAGQINSCNKDTGQCTCKENVVGRDCDMCSSNYTNLHSMGCEECDCLLANTNTSADALCDPVTAQCACRPSALGLRCDSCQDSYYEDSEQTCLECNCNTTGSSDSNCAPLTGQCTCSSENITGRTCDSCEAGHYNFPNCISCQCNASGSINSICDSVSGQCQCKEFVTGTNCDTCLPGYKQFDDLNPFGCSAKPEGQDPPTVSSVLSNSIFIRWMAPAKPNGVIYLYSIVRDGVIIDSIAGSLLFYNDTGLTPFTSYVYQIESENIIGEARSDGINATTLEGEPEQVNAPSLTVLNSTSIRAEWIAPNVPNGIIVTYNLLLIAVDNAFLESPVTIFSGLAFTYTVTGLDPFTENTYILEACTSQKCGSSNQVSATTEQAAPEFQASPTLATINSTAITVTWVQPSKPNGVIVKYEIFQRISPFSGDGFSIGNVSSNVFSFVAGGLQPFMEYEFSVASFTNIGGTQSGWTRGKTGETVPENLFDPIVTAVSSSELKVQWFEPAIPNGVISQYMVHLQYPDNSTDNVVNSTSVGSYVVSDLSPFTTYGVFVIVCNTAGCATSNTAYNTTLESAPTGLQSPTFSSISSTSLELTWEPPTEPNGIITNYSVRRSRPSLQSSPARRDIGTTFTGADFASYAPSSDLSGDSTTISLMFKTLRPDGVLVYSIDSLRTDMIAIELRDGIPWFVFDAGDGPAAITLNGDTKYNDGQWHTLTATRSGKAGDITVDGESTGTGMSLGSAIFVALPSVLYIGGLENDAALTTIKGEMNPNATLNGFSFAGCLFGVKFNDNYLNLSLLLNSNPGVGSSSEGCPVEQEFGVSFLGGGYLSMPYTSPRNSSFSLSIWFRTQRSSSLLFFAYSSESYILAMLEDSDLVVKVKGVGGTEIVLSSSQISLANSLCDGEWYLLDIVKDSDGIVVEIANQSISTSANSLNISTTSNFYIGGVPVSSEAWDDYYNLFSMNPIAFSGCTRNFKMDGTVVNLHQDFGDAIKHVRFDGCDSSPVDDTQSCSQETTLFSSGSETSFTDTGLAPFTGYLYQVVAENSGGEGSSSWSTEMTGESSPEEIGVVVVDGSTSSSLSVSWSQQEKANGLITQYAVEATPLSTVGLDSPNGVIQSSLLDIESPNQELSIEVFGLEPASNYSLVLLAYTGVGFGTGPPVYASTLEDVPIGVQTPDATVQSSTEVFLQWEPPSQPNGIITIYRIYIADTLIESTSRNVTVQSLKPFTTYEYTLEACTQVGCANSSSASVFTFQGTPEGLSPPSLLSLSSTRVQASWTSPSEPNGIITHYELFRVYGQDLTQSELVANTTELTAVITGLLPNTLYYFKLIAYNSVGSVTSNVSSTTTPEDSPDQVLPPDVTVVSSTSLLIVWQEPLQPNGVITSYTVFRDGSSVFTGVANFSYLDTGLSPFTHYSYFLLVCNAIGCGASTTITERTDEALAESLQQPEVVSVTSNSASFIVKSVGKPNGIVRYILRVSGEFLVGYSNDIRQTVVETRVVFNESVPDTADVLQLLPFTSYSLWLEVVNGAGSVFGDTDVFTTSQAAPELISPPQVTLVSAVVLSVVWSLPVYPNGNITSYSIDAESMAAAQTYTFSADTTSTVIHGLTAFSEYSVYVTATNIAGNVTSEETVIVTGETTPADFDHPTVTSTTAYSIAIAWDPPATPNGVIRNYTVVATLSETDEVIDMVTLPASSSQYNITELIPFTDYNITVEACNSADCEIGPSIVVMTDEAAPELINAPTYSVLSTSVIVHWEEPKEKNGIITLYTIYRAVAGGVFSILQSVMVEEEEELLLQHTDSAIEPFTTYQYYIEASNSAGTGRSNVSSVLTEEAEPENVLEPVLEALSSSSVLITVLPPLKPNGIITKYTVARYLNPSIIHYTDVDASNDPNQNVSLIDTGLEPYTVYFYFVIAFTVAGNATGNTSSVRTLEAPPSDLSSPNVVLSADTSILLGWQAPLEPNGVITLYQVVRGSFGHAIDTNNTEAYQETLRDCCVAYVANSDSSGVELNDDCVLVTETDGETTSYIDSGLNPYVYYGYCIAAYNGAGGVASSSSEILQTSPAPQPLSGPNATAVALNSSAISVAWTEPDPSVLLGPLTSYTLYSKVAGEDGLGDELFSGLDQEYVVGGLTPSTTYTFTVEVSNSRGAAFGPSVDETTMDGIPNGVQDPIIQIISATSILITWVEPLMPNGEIVQYSIFLNSELHHSQSTPGSLVVTGLKPFTTYTARLEACTALGCSRSGLSINKTLEAAPSGFASPSVDILSPYTAFVYWSAPLQPNGIVNQYNLYVREQGYEKDLVFSGFAFNYTVNDLNPATQYGFEVVAINGGGNVSSGFTTKTTDEAPPSLVLTPDVVTLSAYSILIEWEEPDEPNGVVTGYNLFRNGEMINGMINTLMYTDTSLSPFTDYSYVLQACTSAGCTNSTTGSNKTFEATPSDFADPVFSNVQSDSFIISWLEPDSPNGIITKYTVSFSNGTTVFTGLSNFTSLQGLLPYTNYSLIVTVCNSVDCLDSNTVTVATQEAPPSDLSAPSVKGLSSMSVEVTWNPPLKPNGVITTYRLRRDDEVIFDGLALIFDDEGLEGDTQYVYTVEAVNSAGSTISPVIVVQTQADIPSGVASPTITVLSSTSIYAEWSEPENENGVLSSYKLFVNNEEVVSGFRFNYTVTGLAPATEYTFYVQVCNQIGCASSKSVTGTTEEDVPSGLSKPILTPLSPTTVLVSWSEPDMPNGVITEYRILRRETDNPLLVLIQHVASKDETNFMNQDLKPYTSYEYQVVALNSKGSTESEWTEVTTLEAPPTDFDAPTFPVVQSTYVIVSWEAPANPNGVITQYQVMYAPLLQELELYQTLSADVTQVNVTGLVPFTFYQLKIIASNSAGEVESGLGNVQTLEDAPEGLGLLILVTRTSESVTLTWDEPSKPNGIIFEYVLYLDGVEEYRDSPRMATIDRLKPFTSYAIELEACTSAACTRSMVIQSFTTEESAPIGQPPPTLSLINTRSVMVTWGFPLQSNGIIISYDVLRSEVPEPLVDNMTESAILVYTTTDVSNRIFNDTNLTPDTGYQYAVRANNSVGHSLSAFVYIQTPQAAPESVQPAILEVMGTSNIRITWNPPGQNNGELTQYQIYRTVSNEANSVQVYTGLNREFTDTGLTPFTQYFYTIEACTIAGCTNSSVKNATTDESVPESIAAPELVALSSSSISVTWSPPDTPNGVIVSYEVNVISPVSLNLTIGPDLLSATVMSLEPYVEYSVRVQVCTKVGCVVSESSVVRTLESVPMLQGAPTLLALGPSSIDVTWSEPEKPNGVIINYILRRNDTLVYEGPETTVIDSSLLPNQKYSYDVQSFTSIGGGERSPSSIVTTHSDTPTGVNPPVLLPLDSTSILATWTVPNVTNGDIQKYILYVNESSTYEGIGLGHVVMDLGIFTTYSFRVEACTTTCGSSLYSYATTKESIPSDLAPPTVALSTNQTVSITWLPPATPNGIILTYTVDRAQVIDEELSTVVTIAEGIPATNQELQDSDSSLTPATTYSYRVTAANSVGSVTSDFSSITLPDGIPQNLSAPILASKTSTSFTVTVSPPKVPNGVLTQYTLFGDNLFPIVVTPSSQEDPVTFTHSDLEPFTTYRVYAEVCTVGGCDLGSATTIQTDEDIPEGLLAPFVTTESPRRIRFEWTPPSKPNGVITGYQLYYKLPCPQPSVSLTAVNTLCTETNYKLVASTTSTTYVFDSSSTLLDPHPYTSYQFLLQTENAVGAVNSSETGVVTTDESIPEQINPLLFTVYTSNQSIALNWGSTFRLNGQLKSYTVIRDGVFLFIGTQTYAVFPNQPVNTVLQFSVRVSNMIYQLTSTSVPLIITIDPGTPNFTMTSSPKTTATSSPSDKEFYEDAPFIIGMVVLAIIICFVLMVVILCIIRPNQGRESGKYDTLRSEKGSPLHASGTIGSGWTHERMTPVPSYHDALHNYPTSGPKAMTSSYSPVKAETSLNNSYSKAELAAYYLQEDEIPLVDTHIARLSVHEEIPMKEFTPDQKQKVYELTKPGDPASEPSSDEETAANGGQGTILADGKLRKNLPITDSQESMLDTKI